jgi:hypothetical protein
VRRRGLDRVGKSGVASSFGPPEGGLNGERDFTGLIVERHQVLTARGWPINRGPQARD